jgi:hypothetical protein
MYNGERKRLESAAGGIVIVLLTVFLVIMLAMLSN